MKAYYARPERREKREGIRREGEHAAGISHGTRGAYNAGCRCRQCRCAHAEYTKKYYASRGVIKANARLQNLLANPGHHLHGTTSGYAEGCRCDHCRDAARAHYTSPKARERARVLIRARRQRYPDLVLAGRFQRRTNCALRRIAAGRFNPEQRIPFMSCTYEELRLHIEKRFSPGMHWGNLGRDGWGVDHLKPCVCFRLTESDQIPLCFGLNNLRPAWISDNLRKGSLWDGRVHHRGRTLVPRQKQSVQTGVQE